MRYSFENLITLSEFIGRRHVWEISRLITQREAKGGLLFRGRGRCADEALMCPPLHLVDAAAKSGEGSLVRVASTHVALLRSILILRYCRFKE